MIKLLSHSDPGQTKFHLCVCNVGDSLAYVYSGGQVGTKCFAITSIIILMTRIIWKFYDYKIPRFERLLWEATTSRQTGTCEMHLVPSALLTASILSSATLRAGGDMESVVCNIYFSSFQYHRGAAGRYCFPHKRRNLGQFRPSGKPQLNPDQ